MNKRFVPDVYPIPDISKECSKCPILIKEIGVIKDLQVKLMNKIDELINTSKLINRLENVEKNVEIIMRLLTAERTNS
jgi:hypothetical protein